MRSKCGTAGVGLLRWPATGMDLMFLLHVDIKHWYLAPRVSQTLLPLLQDLIDKVFRVDLSISVKLGGLLVNITIFCLAVLDVFRRQPLAQLRSTSRSVTSSNRHCMA